MVNDLFYHLIMQIPLKLARIGRVIQVSQMKLFTFSGLKIKNFLLKLQVSRLENMKTTRIYSP